MSETLRAPIGANFCGRTAARRLAILDGLQDFCMMATKVSIMKTATRLYAEALYGVARRRFFGYFRQASGVAVSLLSPPPRARIKRSCKVGKLWIMRLPSSLASNNINIITKLQHHDS